MVAGLGVAGAAIAVLLAALLVATDSELTWAHYRTELIGALFTIAVGVVLSVVVATLIEHHRQRSARRAADRELRRSLIAQLRDVHDQVKAAALLINAHRSAQTYGEQMRRLIEVRVRLLDARRTIRSESRAFGGDRESLSDAIHSSVGYLVDLTAEYECEYLRVSMIQLYSHEWNLAQARKAAQRERPPLPEEMTASTIPWDELTGEAFSRLRALRGADAEADAEHVARFSEPLGRAIDTLRRQNAERV